MTQRKSIHCILCACITRYLDTRMKLAHVRWITRGGRPGETIGNPQSPYMQALLLRALREGVTVTREEF